MDPTNVVDFSTFVVNVVLPLLSAIVMALAGVAATYLTKKFKLQNAAVIRGYFMEYVQKGVDYSKGQLMQLASDGKFNMNVKNAAVALGANFVINQAPIAMKALNFSEAQVRDLVEAELNKLLGQETSVLELTVDKVVTK